MLRHYEIKEIKNYEHLLDKYCLCFLTVVFLCRLLITLTTIKNTKGFKKLNLYMIKTIHRVCEHKFKIKMNLDIYYRSKFLTNKNFFNS